MLNHKLNADAPDAELVSLSLAGNRDAFGRIVARYQALICSLAYNATGSLSQSEDLAQETFITAWKKLGDVREPAKLRPWLCGIARNLINNSFRRHDREPSHAAESLDALSESSSAEPAPAEHAISREEEAILWRSLEKIPENYREPLILFYREHQSVECVATALDLSEDAVRQRLSRGRKLLQDEVIAFVEGALRQSGPGRAFTFGVLAALPLLATSAKAATIGATAAKGTALATSTKLLSFSGVLLGPLVGLIGAYVGVRSSLDATRTTRERVFVMRQAKNMLIAIMLMNAVLFAFIMAATRYWKIHPVLYSVLVALISLAMGGYIIFKAVRYNIQFRRLRAEEQENHPEAFDSQNAQSSSGLTEYRSARTFLGLPLFHKVDGVPRPGEKSIPAIGWIAMGNRAYGILFACGGFAVGGISMGGVSVGILSMGGLSAGLIAIGGASVGIFALGGLALGGLALGGGAIGVLAAGGLATGLVGAQGGLSVARDFALGGVAIAHHANDAAAREYFAAYPWMDVRNPVFRNLATILTWLPLIIVSVLALHFQKLRRRKQLSMHEKK